MIGWLTKLAVTLGLLGLLAFDGISMVTTTFNATDHANTAARDASEAYKVNKNVQSSYDAAVAAVVDDGDTIETKTFAIDPATGRVTLELHREAPTLWVYRVGPLKKYTDIKAKGQSVS